MRNDRRAEKDRSSSEEKTFSRKKIQTERQAEKKEVDKADRESKTYTWLKGKVRQREK